MRRLLGKLRDESSNGGTAEDSDPKSVGPQVLYDGTGDSSSGVDIIFVHGLRGSAYRSWSKGDICWPRDLLKDDIPRARVITWGYDSDVARFFSYASKESIFGHADTLLGDLARLRQDITRPIVFVAHSLGGLVVKTALIKSDEYKNHNRHAGQADIYASTCGVAFFGTPHRGSSKEGYGEILAGIAKFCMRQPNKSLLETLKKDSHILEGQRDAWTTISNDMRVICVREELPTVIGMIVPEASASYDGFKVQSISINANHSDMVKFDDREDPMYQRAAGLLVNLAQTAEEDHFKAQLQVLWFEEIQDREVGIEDAHSSTFRWIASEEKIMTKTDTFRFESWVDSHHSGLFISGKAASGKSTLMKHLWAKKASLIQKSQWAFDISSVIFATFFFHERGSDLQKSREGMLRSLTHQILSQIPMELFDTKSSLTWDSLKSIFHSAIDGLEARGKKLFLFLDGLDEFRLLEKIGEYTEEQKDLIYDGGTDDAAWGVSTWITDGYREISMFILELCAKQNVKVCFACRELSLFEGKFKELPRLQLQECTQKDIRDYSYSRLSMEAPDLPRLDDFAISITHKASGVFLWVRLVIDTLVNGNDDGDTTQELWSTLEHLPIRLGGENGLYMSMLRRVRESHRSESARLFGLVASVRHPLHLLQVSFAAESFGGNQANVHESCVKIEEEGRSGFSALCETYLRRLKSRCGGLLEADPFVSFMHQTVKEFMQRTYARDLLFADEPEYTQVDVCSAAIEGFIAFMQVVERIPPTDTSDTLWRGPTQPLVSLENTLDHLQILDHSCADIEGYVSLVDRLNATEITLRDPSEYNNSVLNFKLKSHKELYRMRWFKFIKDKAKGLTSAESMSFAARRNLSKYINFRLGLQTPSQRVYEACRLWKCYFPFGEDCEWITIRRDVRSQPGSEAYRASESGIGISTCKILLPHVAQLDNHGNVQAMEIVLPAWAHALSIGCKYFKMMHKKDAVDRYAYGEDWLELILLMLEFGVPVDTPVCVRTGFVGLGPSATLPSSEILLRILELGTARSFRDTSLIDLEAQILGYLPENVTSPLFLKELRDIMELEIDIN